MHRASTLFEVASTVGLGSIQAEAPATPVRLLSCVQAQVAVEVRLLRKGCVAVVAGKGTLPRVGAHVPLEVGALGEGTRAQVAPEGALSRVRAQVRRHARAGRGRVGAQPA